MKRPESLTERPEEEEDRGAWANLASDVRCKTLPGYNTGPGMPTELPQNEESLMLFIFAQLLDVCEQHAVESYEIGEAIEMLVEYFDQDPKRLRWPHASTLADKLTTLSACHTGEK